MAVLNSLLVTEKTLIRIPLELDREAETFLRYAIAQWIPDALFRLARKVSESDDRATMQLLQRDYSLVCSGGLGQLSAATGTNVAIEPFFYDRIDPSTVTTSSSSFRVQYVVHPGQLDLPRPKQFLYYTVTDSKVIVKNTDGLTTSFSGTLNFSANFLPLLGSVPLQLQSRFFDEMVGIATEKLGSQSFLERAVENQTVALARAEQEKQEQMMRRAQGERAGIPNPDSDRGRSIG